MQSGVMVAAGQTVVGVDDDFQVRETLEDLVESAGQRCMVFSSAEEFLESGALAEATCVMTDVRMTGIDGIELQRLIRLQRPTLPIIFITAHYDRNVQRLALEGGASAFMYKPFNASDLLAAIDLAIKT